METESVEVDDALFEVLESFSVAARAVKAPWLVVGATARIILLEKVYGLPRGVATQDIDFGVQVGDWEHYQRLCDFLTQDGASATERKPTKRFKSKQDMIFDLVPYGGVEDKDKQVFWPPHEDDVMTVRGFESAANNAVSVIVNEKLTVPVVSPAGLCALKLFAWQERHAQHPGRDTKDIAYLFTHIGSLYSAEKLHTQYSEAVLVADYAIQSAGHYQLGCDVGALLTSNDLEFMKGLLSDELSKNEDSMLCREIHKYTKMASAGEGLEALLFFNKGLCSDQGSQYLHIVN